MTESQIAFRLRVDETFLKRCKETFLDHGFIDERWAIVNWGKRQFVSDVSSSRVRKFRTKRALKQDETFRELDETQSETAPDTEQIQRAEHTTTTATQQRRGCRIPESFKVTEAHRQFARERSLPNPDTLIEHFRDHWMAKAGKDGTKLDWNACFRTWIRNAANFSKPNGGRSERSVSKTGGNQAALDEVLRSRRDREGTDEAGLCKAGSGRSAGPRLLLDGTGEA